MLKRELNHISNEKHLQYILQTASMKISVSFLNSMFNKVFYYEQTILYKHRIEDNVSFVVNYDMNSVQWFVKTNCVIK